MSFGWAVAICLAFVLVWGVGYGIGIGDGKLQAIESFKTYGAFEHRGTKVTSSKIEVDPTGTIHPPAPPRPDRMTFDKSNGRGIE